MRRVPKKPEICAYADGSASQKEGRDPVLGAGILLTIDQRPVLARSIKLDWLLSIRDVALVAEVGATISALNAAPTGCKVIIFSDRPEIRDYIEHVDYRRRISAGASDIAALFRPLANAIKRHGNGNIEAPEKSNSHRFFSAANALAVRATGSTKFVMVRNFQGILNAAEANGHMLHRL